MLTETEMELLLDLMMSPPKEEKNNDGEERGSGVRV